MAGLVGTRDGEGPLDAARMREHNLAVVLRDLSLNGRAARTDLADRTGLARGSITSLVPELMAAGLVRDSESPEPSGAGRPARPVELDGSHVAVLCLQVGTTSVIVRAVDLAGRPFGPDTSDAPGPLGTPDRAADRIAALASTHIERLRAQHVEVARMVVVIAAPVLSSPPTVMLQLELGWGAVDLVSMLQARMQDFTHPIDLMSDGNLAALAEYRALQARGEEVQSIVYLKPDSGVGGGVVLRGDVLSGANGVGFEPGHVVVRPGGNSCSCGRRGCLAVEAGPERTIELAALQKDVEHEGMQVVTASLSMRAETDHRTREALAAAGRLLQEVVLDLGRLFDPDFVLLGGYWASVLPWLRIDPAAGAGVPSALERARLERHPGPFVRPGLLGSDAALDGAAQWGVAALLEDPAAIPRPSAHRPD